MLSRVADHLYWMSRYLERAEHLARVLDINLQRSLEQSASQAAKRWDRVVRAMRITELKVPLVDPMPIARALAFDPSVPESIVSCISGARDNARNVRQQLSSEMWEQINMVYLRVRKAAKEDPGLAELHAFFREVKSGSHLFEGITSSTMTHDEGYYFVQVGRFIERAQATAALLDATLSDLATRAEAAPEIGDYYEWICLLKSCTAFEAYCREYTADLKPERIAEFLLLNPSFPHSLHFAAVQVQAALEYIADRNPGRTVTRVNRLAGRLGAMLGFGQIDEILAGDIHSYLGEVQRLCQQIQSAVSLAYIAYPIETALVS